jgi:hypothetical protein
MLLKAYFGSPNDSQRVHQKLMKIMSDLREAMWAQVQRGVSKLDFDYEGYGQKYFDRFEANTSTSDYTNWLHSV